MKTANSAFLVLIDYSSDESSSIVVTGPFRIESLNTYIIWHCWPWSIGNCPLLDTWNQFNCRPIHLHFCPKHTIPDYYLFMVQYYVRRLCLCVSSHFKGQL